MTNEPRIFRVELPAGLPTLNANDRPALMKRKNGARVPVSAKKAQRIREEAYRAAKAQPFIPFAKCRVRCIFRAPDNRRRDVANLYPSFKSALDGIVDAGVIRDDNDSIVREFSIVRGENLPKKGQLIIQIIEEDE